MINNNPKIATFEIEILIFVFFSLDMLIMHSSSVYPGLKLWRQNPSLDVKALALINPRYHLNLIAPLGWKQIKSGFETESIFSGHRVIKAMKPEWFISNCVRLTLTPWGRWLFNKVGPPVLSMKGVAVKLDSLDNVVLAANTMHLARVHRVSSVTGFTK